MELEVGFDAAKREKRSFWGRVGWEGVVVETRSFNFRGFWGPVLAGATVDHRSANESVINAIVCQEEGLEDEIARRMGGERMQAGASIIIVLVGGGDRMWSPPTTSYEHPSSSSGLAFNSDNARRSCIPGLENSPGFP